MKKNARLIKPILCMVAFLLCVNLVSCNSFVSKKKMEQIKRFAETDTQWVTDDISEIIHRSQQPSIDAEIEMILITNIRLAPHYTLYYRELYELWGKKMGLISFVAYNGNVYGTIEYGTKDEVGNDIFQFKIDGVDENKFILFVNNLVQKYNSEVNNTILRLLSTRNSSKKMSYFSDLNGDETEYYNCNITDVSDPDDYKIAGGISCEQYKDGTLCFLEVVENSDQKEEMYAFMEMDDLIWNMSVSELNEFEVKKSEISLNELLKNNEIVLSDPEIYELVQSIR